MQKPAEKTTTGNYISDDVKFNKSYQKVWPFYENNVKCHVVQLLKKLKIFMNYSFVMSVKNILYLDKHVKTWIKNNSYMYARVFKV